MNFIDIIIGIPLLWAIYKGFNRGLIVEIATFIGFWLGIWGGIHFSNYIASLIQDYFHLNSSYIPVLAFFITFLLIIVLIYLLAKLIQKIAEGMALGFINKLGGALFGFLKYTFIISVFIFILNSIQNDYPVLSPSLKKQSVLYTEIGKIAPFILPQLKELKLESLR